MNPFLLGKSHKDSHRDIDTKFRRIREVSVLVFNLKNAEYLLCSESSQIPSKEELQLAGRNLELVECLYCGNSFNKREIVRHKNEEEQTLHCNYCDQDFDSVHGFRRHMYRYHKLYSCDKCNIRLLKGAYEYHMRSVHSTRAVCNLCGKEFATRRSLLTHSKKIHLGQRDTRWKCALCSYQAPDNYQFSVHLARHRKTPSLVCDQCGARRYTPTELRRHIQIEHQGGFRCNICQKVFRCSAYLKKHIICHDQLFSPKNFSCEECGKGFSSSINMKRHLLRHRNQMPIFHCDTCGKDITSKQSFAAHLRMHSGAKPFVCEVCHKSFAEKRYLRWHAKQHDLEIT